MTQALVVTVLAVILTVVAAGRYWDEYGAGNAGVHSNPVFKVQPTLRWTTGENPDNVGFIGVLPLDNEEKAVYVSNGDGSNPPSIWKYSWDGDLLWTWNDTNFNWIDGTLSVRNGVVYSFNDALSYLTGVEYATNKVVFTNVTISSVNYVGNPVIWNDANTIIYVSTDIAMSAVNASTGEIIWNVVLPAGVSSIATRSRFDNSLIVVSNTTVVTKYSMNDGSKMWSYTATYATVDQANTATAVSVDAQGYIYGVSFEGVMYKLSPNGALIWEVLDLSPIAFRNSPVLINNDHFIIGDNAVGSIYVVSTKDGTYTQAWNNEKDVPTQKQPINSHMFWNAGVLYALHGDILAAYDTSDLTSLTQLWNLSTTIGYAYQGGISIGNDGTIFVASAAYDNFPLLVSVGCPMGQHVSSQDGSQCGYCNAGFEYKNNKCEKCAANYYSDDADDVCAPCSMDPNNAQCAKPPSNTPIKASSSSAASMFVSIVLYIATCVLFAV